MNRIAISRRALLRGAAMMLGTAVVSGIGRAGAQLVERPLVAKPARIPITGKPYPETDVWTYNGLLPGPEIRLRQGDRLRVRLENRLVEETTIHWHGVRVPNAMDGVPHLTQPPVAPGGTFTYEFDLPDAGTYWYHPHARSFEQVGRGLSGALIVEERNPPVVDRELVWMLSDWRMLPSAAISDDFGNLHDAMHAGRIGNTVTINGRVPDTIAVRAGERIRLRLINAANARIFGLNFEGHHPTVIAFDGQPVEPHAPEGGRIDLGPAMRADLILDMLGRPGQRFTVTDTFYEGLEYRLVDLLYEQTAPVREHPLGSAPALAPNPIPRPDTAIAERHDIVLGGGMMGGMMGAMVGGHQMDMRSMMQNGLAWAMNGVAGTGHVLDPLLTLARGSSCILTLKNETAWHHPMHLHGHVFRVLSRDGNPVAREEWRDTVLVNPKERVEIAFVADNPGDWMIHCHILEHQATGMMGVVRVV